MGFLRGVFIVGFVIMLSTLGINAFDNLNTPGQSLIGAAISSISPRTCPEGMAFVETSHEGFCIDSFEASPNSTCLYDNPQNKSETDENFLLQDCQPVSVHGATPWRHISRQQAELACARAGKRLPTNAEWYRAALGTPDKSREWGDEDCNVASRSDEPDLTGSRPECVSAAGAYDMIGNVWEWLEETAEDGQFEEEYFPNEGYIADINSGGIPIKTNPDEPDIAFFEDYFWLDDTDVRGMLRGGYWKSKSDAGQYALNVTVPPSFIGNAVGFRCVASLN